MLPCRLPKPQQQIANSSSCGSTTKRFGHITSERLRRRKRGSFKLKADKISRKVNEENKKKNKLQKKGADNNWQKEIPEILTKIEREVLALINNSDGNPSEKGVRENLLHCDPNRINKHLL